MYLSGSGLLVLRLGVGVRAVGVGLLCGGLGLSLVVAAVRVWLFVSPRPDLTEELQGSQICLRSCCCGDIQQFLFGALVTACMECEMSNRPACCEIEVVPQSMSARELLL